MSSVPRPAASHAPPTTRPPATASAAWCYCATNWGAGGRTSMMESNSSPPLHSSSTMCTLVLSSYTSAIMPDTRDWIRWLTGRQRPLGTRLRFPVATAFPAIQLPGPTGRPPLSRPLLARTLPAPSVARPSRLLPLRHRLTYDADDAWMALLRCSNGAGVRCTTSHTQLEDQHPMPCANARPALLRQHCLLHAPCPPASPLTSLCTRLRPPRPPPVTTGAVFMSRAPPLPHLQVVHDLHLSPHVVDVAHTVRAWQCGKGSQAAHRTVTVGLPGSHGNRRQAAGPEPCGRLIALSCLLRLSSVA